VRRGPVAERMARARWALLAGCAAVCALVAVLHGPMFTAPGEYLGVGSFHPSHVWCFDHITRGLAGEVPLDGWTDRIAFPGRVAARFIAWVPALISAPLNPLFGPLAAYNLSMVVSCALAVPFVWALAHRSLGASNEGAVAAGVLYAVSPPVIGALANGQTCKAQVWTVPAVLLAVHVAATVEGGARFGLALIGVAVAAVAAAFTEPTYALLLALVLPFWGLAVGAGQPTWRDGAWSVARAALASGVVAGCFLVAARYYDVPEDVSGFVPSRRLGLEGAINQLQQQVSIDVLVGLGASRFNTTGTVHVGYLGVPALLVVLVAWVTGRLRTVGPTLPLLVVGVVIALGEWLAVGEQLYRSNGSVYALPAAWLGELGFPLARSGQYYRAMVLVWLGVALAASVGFGAAGEGARGHAVRRWGPVAVAALLLADGLRVTASAWPFPVERDSGHEVWAELAADPVPGGVLDFPLQVGNHALGVNMLAGAYHGRPVPAVPIWSPITSYPTFQRYVAPIVQAIERGPSERAYAQLRAAGFRYVVFRTHRPGSGPSYEQVARSLGEPSRTGSYAVWRVPES
jgi:hypothetical protein